MDNLLLYSRLSSLPEHMKEEVAALIDKLLSQKKNKEPQKTKAKFGSGKDMFVIKPGFDDVLEHFNEYMH